MGKRTNHRTVNRRGLVSRYAALRGVSHARAEQMTRTWDRTELRECVERIEREERPYEPRRARSMKGQLTTVGAYTTMVDGVVR